jgi:hypothetical protein
VYKAVSDTPCCLTSFWSAVDCVVYIMLLSFGLFASFTCSLFSYPSAGDKGIVNKAHYLSTSGAC